jgi:riboflavin kinase/FMN adenylyltransferase
VKPEGELLPKPGIYAGRAVILAEGNGGGTRSTHVCALSIGTNPTFTGSGALTIEAHLLDFDGDLYGHRLRLEIAHRLRDEQRFESTAALVEQIHADFAETRRMMAR